MGQLSVSLHSVGPDLLHIFHCTVVHHACWGRLCCDPGEWRANCGARMFKTDSTRILRSVALRCGLCGLCASVVDWPAAPLRARTVEAQPVGRSSTGQGGAGADVV